MTENLSSSLRIARAIRVFFRADIALCLVLVVFLAGVAIGHG